MAQPDRTLFSEISDHPGFEAFLEGLRNERERVRRLLQSHDGTVGLDFAVQVARLQGMLRQLDWSIDTYPKLLTGEYDPDHPVGTGGEDAYETTQGATAFSD